MAVKLVNLSGPGMDQRRITEKDIPRNTSVLPEYQGLSYIDRAKKAANIASGNGRAWWIYDYVYRELTWREKK